MQLQMQWTGPFSSFPYEAPVAAAAVALPVPAASVLNTLKIFEEFYMELQLVQACSKPPGSLQRFLVGEFMRDTRHAVTSCRTLVIPGSYLISFVWIFLVAFYEAKLERQMKLEPEVAPCLPAIPWQVLISLVTFKLSCNKAWCTSTVRNSGFSEDP